MKTKLTPLQWVHNVEVRLRRLERTLPRISVRFRKICHNQKHYLKYRMNRSKAAKRYDKWAHNIIGKMTHIEALEKRFAGQGVHWGCEKTNIPGKRARLVRLTLGEYKLLLKILKSERWKR